MRITEIEALVEQGERETPEAFDEIIAKAASGPARVMHFERDEYRFKLTVNDKGIFLDKEGSDGDEMVLGLRWQSVAQIQNADPGKGRPMLFGGFYGRSTSANQNISWNLMCHHVAEMVRDDERKLGCLHVVDMLGGLSDNNKGLTLVQSAFGRRTLGKTINYAPGAFDDIWPSVYVGCHENENLLQVVLVRGWDQLYHVWPRPAARFIEQYDYPGAIVAASLGSFPTKRPWDLNDWVGRGFDIHWCGVRDEDTFSWIEPLLTGYMREGVADGDE